MGDFEWDLTDLLSDMATMPVRSEPPYNLRARIRRRRTRWRRVFIAMLVALLTLLVIAHTVRTTFLAFPG
jgi:hypothetical protein